MSNIKFAKWMVWLNGGVPLAILAWDALHHRLGADPTNFAIRTTGMLALIFLTLSLVVTPLRKLTGWNDLITFRRVLGLYGFYYAATHFLIYFTFDQGRNVNSTFHEILSKRYLQIGFAGLSLMIPLAITSTNFMVRWLGNVKWHALHRLAYVAVIAGVIHFWIEVKSDVTVPRLFAIAVGGLLGFRYVAMFFTSSMARSGKGRGMTAAKPTGGVPAKKKFWSGELKVARIFEETPTVRTFRLTPPDGSPLPFDYLPGQYLNLALEVDGKRVNRSYTIASSPSRNGSVEITVKREDMGVSSRHLHDQIREGHSLRVSAPAGKFTFVGKESNHVVLIAAGVGITPLMSVVRYLTDHAWPGEIDLIFSAKSESEIIFRREIETLRARFPNFHVTFTLTKPTDTWQGERGRVSADMIERIVPTIRDSIIHICGPTPMMDATRDLLLGIGVASERIKTEKFESPPMPTAEQAKGGETSEVVEQSVTESNESDGDSPTVMFETSGKSAPSAAGEVILETAEQAGVDIPFECRSGICGTCKVKLLSGQVEMDTRDALTAADESSNIILACQARPIGDVSVEA